MSLNLPLFLNSKSSPAAHSINELTLSEISDHLKSAIENVNNNSTYKLRDISDINLYANRIIASKNPIVFSEFFIGKKRGNDFVIQIWFSKMVNSSHNIQ